jgi:hypothetical protein
VNDKTIRVCKKNDPFCNCILCIKYWEHMDNLGDDDKIDPEFNAKLTDEMIIDKETTPIINDDFDDYDFNDDFNIELSDI